MFDINSTDNNFFAFDLFSDVVCFRCVSLLSQRHQIVAVKCLHIFFPLKTEISWRQQLCFECIDYGCNCNGCLFDRLLNAHPMKVRSFTARKFTTTLVCIMEIMTLGVQWNTMYKHDIIYSKSQRKGKKDLLQFFSVVISRLLFKWVWALSLLRC